MQFVYLKLVHRLLTQIGFQHVNSQRSVYIMFRHTDCQQLPSYLSTMRGLPRTGFMSQFSKSRYNTVFCKTVIKIYR
jgi:hypothetical protein